MADGYRSDVGEIGWGTDDTRITTWPGLCPDDLPNG
jgi:hypothetical protein